MNRKGTRNWRFSSLVGHVLATLHSHIVQYAGNDLSGSL